MNTVSGQKNKASNINTKRAKLEAKYKEQNFKRLKTIDKIAIKSAADPNAQFDDLLRVISDDGVLYQAMGNINKKKGSLTQGPATDPTTADASSAKLIEKLSKDLRNKTFRFNPIRRVYMDKSGKSPVTEEQKAQLLKLHKQGKVTMAQIKELKARPLGISSFPDKIVQEAMRMVLTAIYEPEFSRTNTNFGFRPGKGCQDAIHQIQQKAKAMDYAIEGDIKGAFDNVNHKKMIEILGRKIKDQCFLRLVMGGLKCGVMFLNYRQDSDLGTTQGSVVSPLLYNIYFHEFDKYITTEFTQLVHNINETENRKDRPINKLYRFYGGKRARLKLPAMIENYKKLYKEQGTTDDTILLSQEIKKTRKIANELEKKQKSLKSRTKSRQTIRFWYTRYADDWLLLSNADYPRMVEWKSLFTKWISEKLQLAVSEEKTKITEIRKGDRAKFLGFSITRAKGTKLINMGLYKKTRTDILSRIKYTRQKLTDEKIYKIRSVNTSVVVTWDRERVINRLIQNNMAKKYNNKLRSTSKISWTNLGEQEIVQRYNYIIRGYMNYYAPVTDRPLDLGLLYYILKYSCVHTLAHKRKTTLTKIFTKFGRDVKIKYKTKIQTKDKVTGNEITNITEKEVQLLTWKDCKKIMTEILFATRKKTKRKKTRLNIHHEYHY
uniref:Reverse transcriptase domain-containing protein n=1 Tax=Pseudopediastrum sp. CL0201VA TaxID=2184484 RepID=A0A2U8GJM1_9CHLO|nr:hypothetical protein [Pseudopediastrum sp. CL0201VA]AWI68862.1 hypothetical protein [Pseudopediastrum sp. CL0201VA]